MTKEPLGGIRTEGRRWGVVGGLGPRASAAFLATVYRQCADRPEQQQPIVYLLSDPSIPDRSAALLQGRAHLLAARLRGNIESLLALGATDVVICCVTLHGALGMLPLPIQQRVTSLVDVTVTEIERSERQHLVLSTNGTRAARVFESHPRWGRVAARTVWPDASDQEGVHDLIYDIKTQGPLPAHRDKVRSLMRRYNVPAVVAGCTELHMVVDETFARYRPGVRVVDPLVAVADKIRDSLDATMVGSR